MKAVGNYTVTIIYAEFAKSLATVMKFMIMSHPGAHRTFPMYLSNVIKLISCLLNLAQVMKSVKCSPHLLPLIPTSHHPAGETAVKRFQNTALKETEHINFIHNTQAFIYKRHCKIGCVESNCDGAPSAC